MIYEAAKDDLIGQIIAFLTGSNVSHAAMIYPVAAENGSSNVENQIIEMSLAEKGKDSIYTYPFDVHAKAQDAMRNIYVLRHPKYKEIKPVILQAKNCLEEKTTYNTPLLFLLGGLLVYRKIHVSNALYKFIKPILDEACEAINNWIHDGCPEKAMVCSQFVYHCYNACGNDYKIFISDGNLQEDDETGGVRLIDFLTKSNSQRDLVEPTFSNWQDADEVNEKFFMDMHQKLIVTPDVPSNLLISRPSTDMLKLICEFDSLARNLARELQVPLEPVYYLAISGFSSKFFVMQGRATDAYSEKIC